MFAISKVVRIFFLLSIPFAVALPLFSQSPEKGASKPSIKTTATPPLVTLSPPSTLAPTVLTEKKDADDGQPTLSETKDWLIGKLNGIETELEIMAQRSGASGTTWELTERRTWKTNGLGFEACKMSFTLTYVIEESFKDGWDGKKAEVRRQGDVTFVVNLMDLDPASLLIIENEDPNLEQPPYVQRLSKNPSILSWENAKPSRSLGTRGRLPFKTNFEGKSEWPIYNNGVLYVGLIFNDRELAKRVQKALQNAVTKCGGKAEPY